MATARVLLSKRGAGLAPASSEASRSRGLFGAPYARRYTHKEEHTQGGAHKGRFVATARALLFKGRVGACPRIEQSEPQQGVGWRSTGKVVHTQGGAHKGRFVATAGVLLFKGRVGACPRIERSEPQQGVGWRSTGKVVHTRGGAHKKRCVATAGVLLLKRDAGPAPA